MECPDENQLLAYVEHALPDDAVERLEEHLDRCPACLQCVSAFVVGDAEPSSEDDALLSRYLLVDVLGCGAGGVVYRAFDPVLDRTVALKVIDAGDEAGPEVRAAAMREARVLASLNHPNLVTVHDAVVSGRRVLFAMELVDGDLRAWLASGSRSIADIIAIFVGVADGLSAAHAAGVIHRDLKPANILVDGAGRPRVADFGLADVVAPRARRAGTPAYWAPEQQDGREVDARVDQYALCATLHEALWGAPPQGEPPHSLPSTPVVPRRVRRVVARGLAPSPADRFESMAALRDALAPPRARWRWALGLLAAGGGVALMLSSNADPRCSGAADAWGDRWSTESRARIRESMEHATGPSAFPFVDARLSRYREAWTAMHTEACRTSVVRREQSSAVLDLRMGCLRRAASSADAVVEVLGEMSAEHLERVPQVLATLEPIEACADVEALQRGFRLAPAELRPRVEAARRRLDSARAWLWAGDHAQATAQLELAEANAEAVSYPPLRTELVRLRAELANGQGRHADAERMFREVLVLGHDNDQPGEVFVAARELAAIVGSFLDRPDEGLAFAVMARAIAPDARGRVLADLAVGEIELGRGRLTEAEHALRRALDTEAPGLSFITRHVTRQYLSRVLGMQGRPAEAVEILVPVVDELEAELGSGHSQTAQAQANLAMAYRKSGRIEDARVLFERSLSTLEQVWPSGHATTAAIRGGHAGVLDELGRHEDAEREYRRALADFEAAMGARHSSTLAIRANLGSVVANLGRYAEAEVIHREVLAMLEQYGHDPTATAMVRNALAVDLREQGQLGESRKQLTAAREVLVAQRGPCHPQSRLIRDNLVRLFRHQGDDALALAELRALLEECPDAADPAQRAEWQQALDELEPSGGAMDSAGDQ